MSNRRPGPAPVGHSTKNVDPVKWLALAVSIAALVITLVNNHSQNNKWDALNQPHFKLQGGPYFSAFDELDASAAYSRDWGYNPWFTYVETNGVRSSRVHRNTELVWLRRDSDVRAFSDSTSTGGAKAGTMKEAEEEIAKRGLNKSELRLKKHLQAHFDFRNSGSLTAKRLGFQVDLKWILDPGIIAKVPDADPTHGQWTKIAASDHPVDVPAGQLLSRDVDLFIRPELPLPKKVEFRITYFWQDQKEPSVTTLDFDFELDQWNLT